MVLLCALAAAAVPLRVAAQEKVGGEPAVSVGFTPNYRAIAKHAGPAVVGIIVDGMREPSSSADIFLGELPQLPFRAQLPFHGQGSGFIISTDGLVLTSAHVIAGARRVSVRLSDRREFHARVLGSDPVTDVAVLRIETSDLPVLRLGRADQLQVGDAVVAIGAPFGLEQSVSHGIVSAKGRALPGLSAVPHIQTDAPVNPGHSGGPLLDANAAAVGMHARIYSSSGGYQGLSFAVPIDVVLKVKDQILSHGRMPHVYLGVTVQNLDLTLANALGLGRPRGALVGGVDADSAAESAGLRAGDVITSVNGEPIGQAGELISQLGMALPGDRLRLALWRERKTHELVVRLDEAMDLDEPGSPATSTSLHVPPGLGWRLRTLSEQERSLLGVAGGVWVAEVSDLSAQAGLRVGDVLLSINLQPVLSADDVHRLVRARPAQLALLIDRDGLRLFVPMSLD
jgi:serine protease Do